MILHVVRLDFAGVAAEVRARLEARLAELGSLPTAIGFTIGQDTEKPHISGLVCWFEDRAAMADYHAAPLHDEVGAEVVAAGLPAARLDIDVVPPRI